MILLLMASFGLIFFWEAPGLIRRQQWWELGVFLALLGAGFGFGLLLVMGVEVPYIYTTIGDFIAKVVGVRW